MSEVAALELAFGNPLQLHLSAERLDRVFYQPERLAFDMRPRFLQLLVHGEQELGPEAAQAETGHASHGRTDRSTRRAARQPGGSPQHGGPNGRSEVFNNQTRHNVGVRYELPSGLKPTIG